VGVLLRGAKTPQENANGSDNLLYLLPGSIKEHFTWNVNVDPPPVEKGGILTIVAQSTVAATRNREYQRIE
jgi:hypothetical protein